MNNPTDEQILAVLGRAWNKYSKNNRDGLEVPQTIFLDFLDSLIPVEKPFNPREDNTETTKEAEYWFLLPNGEVKSKFCDGQILDRLFLATGNIFPTREAAELYKAEKLKQLD